jgi:hypothetical protein
MNDQAALALKIEQGEQPLPPPVPTPDNPVTVLALLERVAVDPHADVEKLQRLMTMYERLKAKEAELAFNAAKGRILQELAGVKIISAFLTQVPTVRPSFRQGITTDSSNAEHSGSALIVCRLSSLSMVLRRPF